MNFRKLTLRYLGWCPGIDSAINLIPDKDVSNRKITYSISALGMVVLILGIRSFLLFPHNYAWEIDFDDSDYDEPYGMYVESRTGDFWGIYSIKIRVEAPQNATIQIQLHQRSEGNLYSLWTYRDGVFYWKESPKTEFDIGMSLQNPFIWKIYSESREARIYVDIKYLRQDPSFPH